MLEVFAFETLTGQRLTPLPVSSASWSAKVNSDEAIGCSIPARSREAQRLRAWEATKPGRTSLAAVVGGRIMVAGPIWKRGAEGSDISLTAGGMRSYLARRLVLPLAARAKPMVLPSGDPDTSLDTVFRAADRLSLGTIAKRYVEQALAWPKGNVPIDLPVDVLTAPGQGSERTVLAVDLKDVREVVDALSEVINGPDVEFRAAWAPGGNGVRWVMATGTPAQPRLGSTDPAAVRIPVSLTSEPSIREDGTGLASESYATGGGQSDRVITATSLDSTLLDDDYPLLQVANKGHSSVTDPTTLRGYAEQDTYLGRFVSSGLTLDVPAHERGVPELGRDYWIGDVVTVSIPKGHHLFPDGATLVRRVAAVSGDEKDATYAVTFAEALS